MREFDILPDEETIRKMAAEYNRVKARKELLKRCGEETARPFKIKKTKNYDAAALSEICGLQSDIIAALKCLLPKAPRRLAPSISKTLEIKRKNLDKTRDMYLKSEHIELNYNPMLNCEYDFDTLFCKTAFLQSELLLKLCGFDAPPKVWLAELSAAAVLNLIKK